MSTFYSERYARHKTMETVLLFDSNGNEIEKKLIYINPKILRRIRNIKSWQPYSWIHDDNIVSLSFNFYGNTTLYWVIQYYNGIIDQFEIKPGTTIKIPDTREIEQAFNEAGGAKPSVIGTTVSI